MTANFHDDDLPKPPTDEECQHLLAQHGSLAKWELLRRSGWAYDLVDTVRWIDALMWTGQLDKAHTLSMAALPKLLAELTAQYPDERFWARSIGTMVRCITLADSPERALLFLEQANKIARESSLPNDQVNILMGSAVYPMLLIGKAGPLGLDVLTKLIDIDCRRWTGLAQRQQFDLMLLADISVRMVEAFQIASVTGANVPLALAESAICLYRLHNELDLFQTPGDGTKEKGVLVFALRHLAAAAAFANHNLTLALAACTINPKHQQSSLTGPIAFDVLFVELLAHEGPELLSTGSALIQSIHAWRSAIPTDSSRTALRRHLSTFSQAIMGRLKQVLRFDQTSEIASLLANAEEVFGPARHMYDRLSFAENPSTGFPLITPAMCLPNMPSLGSNVAVVQFVEDDSDLLLIAHHGMSTGSGYGPAQMHRIRHGAHNLSVVAYRFLGSPTKPGEIHSENQRKLLACLPHGSRDTQRRALLDKLTWQFVAQISCILGDALDDMKLDGRDVLLVSGSPHLLQLPMSIVMCRGKRLIERVRSLTVSPSIGVSHYLAARPISSGPFDIAAYCHCTDRHGRNALRWDKLFDQNSTGLASLTNAVLRSVCISRPDGPQVEIGTLNAYANDEAECNMLLIGGHGDPMKGIWLADGYWKPEDMTKEKWRLRKTECAVLPSCCLAEMQWNDSTDSSDVDPGRSEIVGFVASLCIVGIPRVLACPWVVYDLPICKLIPRLVRAAIEKRENGEPYYWARGLREVVVEGLKEPKGFGLYDLANLMLFGAP